MRCIPTISTEYFNSLHDILINRAKGQHKNRPNINQWRPTNLKVQLILHGFKSNKVAGEIEPEVDQDNLTEIKKTKEIPEEDTTDNGAHPQYYICI